MFTRGLAIRRAAQLPPKIELWRSVYDACAYIEFFSQLGLSQLISEPTNFEPHKNPSCIDLVVTVQPNIILDCGTRASLDSYCHHQIVHCKVNFRIPPPLPFERKIWHFNRANSAAIKRSMTSFPWRQHLNVNTDPNWQVKTFTDTLLNIMSNFIPNETKRFLPRNPPWINKPLKRMLKLGLMLFVLNVSRQWKL